ncbi:AI-2E family transporter [Sphingomonas sp. HITSZ_GF]|uniref:AI-2E family transporter n=1 Tax=Sphingomonas sp. HITSZ_GF TaxID=3037247 RepID=UPI00240D4924|nr:AI-2E family transporter [Sphingomonas sp. HITSZ_GF]MDG2533233.1 AI-2E family transporter [Sphingomonas sp. HITSZ_GF]
MNTGTETAQRAARLALVGALLLVGLWVAHGFVPALLWAVVLTIAVDPLHLKLRAWLHGTHPVVIPLIITLLAALIVLVPLAFGVTQALREAHDIVSWIGQAQAQGVPVPEWVARLPFGADAVRSWWQTHLARPEDAAEQLRMLSGSEWLTHSRTIGANVAHRAVVFGFTLLTLFFVLRDRDALLAQGRRAVLKLFGLTGERVGTQAIRSVRGTIDGLVLVGLAVGAIMAVIYLVAGVPHPLLLGGVTAIAAMIPFGAPVVFGLAAVLLLIQGSVVGAVVVVAVGAAIIFVADHFIRPAMIGGATQLPFIWVLIGILGGVETLGLLGLFIGPAVMAVLVMLWREFLAPSPVSPALEQTPEDTTH